MVMNWVDLAERTYLREDEFSNGRVPHNDELIMHTWYVWCVGYDGLATQS